MNTIRLNIKHKPIIEKFIKDFKYFRKPKTVSIPASKIDVGWNDATDEAEFDLTQLYHIVEHSDGFREHRKAIKAFIKKVYKYTEEHFSDEDFIWNEILYGMLYDGNKLVWDK